MLVLTDGLNASKYCSTITASNFVNVKLLELVVPICFSPRSEQKSSPVCRVLICIKITMVNNYNKEGIKTESEINPSQR